MEVAGLQTIANGRQFGFKYDIQHIGQLMVAIRQHNAFYRSQDVVPAGVAREDFKRVLHRSATYLSACCLQYAPDKPELLNEIYRDPAG